MGTKIKRNGNDIRKMKNSPKSLTNDDEQILNLVTQELEDPKKRVIIFIGSGISSAPPASLPTWIEMFKLICEQCSKLNDQCHEVASFAQQIALVAKYKPRYLTRAFDDIERAMGKVSFENTIEEILTPKKLGIPEALKRIVNIPFTGIITTNIDTLIENACNQAAEKGRRPSLIDIRTSKAGRGQSNLARLDNWLWKIHGCIKHPDSWIFTSKQYEESIYENKPYLLALQGVIQGSRVVFVGFGGTDIDIDLVLELLAETSGGIIDQHILLTRKASNMDKKSLANRNIRIIEYGGPKDHSALLRILEKFPIYTEKDIGDFHFDQSLYRNWLIPITENIDIRGIGGGWGRSITPKFLPILDMYIDLYVSKDEDVFQSITKEISDEQREPLVNAYYSNRCLAVAGPPGSGKTTFLRYIARNNLEDPLKSLPFLFSIADINEFIKKLKIELTPDILIEFVLDFSDKKNFGITRKGLENLIENGRCIWLLDSLDLISSSTEREVIVELIEEASRAWNQCKFVLASRPSAITGRSIPSDFKIVNIEEMQEPEIRLFIKTWTNLVYKELNEEQRNYYIEDLYSTILDREELLRLSRNPVMLTSIAIVHSSEKRLPGNRVDLLKEVIEWLIEARERRVGKKYPDKENMIEMYQLLAFTMFESVRGPTDMIGLYSVKNLFSQYLKISIDEAEKLVLEELEETGLLRHRSEGDLVFWHKWFQEYLAAMHIASQVDEKCWKIFQEHIDDFKWKEVLTLVPSCLKRLGTERVNLLLERLIDSCVDSDLKTKVNRAALAGNILRDLHIFGYSPNNVTNWKHFKEELKPLFSEEGQEFSLRIREEAVLAYGIGGDPRLQDLKLNWVTIPGDVFVIGAQATNPGGSNFDIDAEQWEAPPIEVKINPFEIRKYPITVLEFEDFISDGGYSNKKYWSKKGWSWKSSQDSVITLPGDWDMQKLSSNCPVTNVSWFEAEAYCNWLNSSKPNSEYIYKLPTEVQWEYAARRNIPNQQRFPWGNKIKKGEEAEANWVGCNLHRKTPVGMFIKSNTKDNLSDMFGNVEEWCEDTWSDDHSKCPTNGTAFIDNLKTLRIVKGGSAIRYMRLCRPTYRSRAYETSRYPTIGFRPVRIQKEILNNINYDLKKENNGLLLENGKKSTYKTKFDSIAQEYDEYLTKVPYQYINLLQRTFHLTENSTIIDLGCGSGLLALALAPISKNVFALDISKELINIGKEHDINKKIQWICSDVLDFDFNNNFYDLIISFEAFHLFPSQDNLIKRCNTALKKGGSLCIGWLNYHWELSLKNIIVQTFNEYGITWGEWGYQAFREFPKLVEENWIGLNRINKEYIDVMQASEISKIASYLCTIEKATLLSNVERQKLKHDLEVNIKNEVGSDYMSGYSKYFIAYCRKDI